MPDPVEMLTKDHREVEALFEEYRTGRGPAVVRRICDELTVHTAVEEKVVYPALASDVDGGRQMRDHAEKEHAEVKQAILAIERAGYDSSEVDPLMQKIIEGVAEHVREEERDVFPAMRSQISEDRMSQLGSEAQAAKQELTAEVAHAGPLVDLTKEQLYEMAKEKGIEHRSEMNKEELISAIRAS